MWKTGFLLIYATALCAPVYSLQDNEDTESYQPLEEGLIKKRKSLGISVGTTLMSGERFSSEPFLAGGGATLSYDARTWLLDMEVLFHGTAEHFTGAAFLGAFYPFFLKIQTPFAGAGIGAMYAAVDNARGAIIYRDQPDVFTGAGITAYAGAGYIFNRTSNVGFRLHARYFRGFFSMDDPEKSVVHGFLLALEIYFGR
jgi:hypothetical protein